MRRSAPSEREIGRRSLVADLMLVLVVEGVAFWITLGWSEDPDGFTRQELRDHVDEVRKQLLLLDISKIGVLGAQDERIYVEFSTGRKAGLGIDRTAIVAALPAQGAKP